MKRVILNQDEWIKSMHGEILTNKCPKHGDYEYFSKNNTGCDKCIDEKEDIERIELEVSNSGLPEKYHNVIFTDWLAVLQDEINAKAKAQMFVDGKITRMMMMGTCGTGKTMLAAAILRAQVAKCVYPIYTTVPRLTRDIRDWNKLDKSGRKISEQQSMNKYIEAKVLIVDELGSGRCTDDDKQIFSEILCDRYADERQTLLITNLSPDAVKEKVIDERATDRMREGGVFVKLSGKSKRGLK